MIDPAHTPRTSIPWRHLAALGGPRLQLDSNRPDGESLDPLSGAVGDALEVYVDVAGQPGCTFCDRSDYKQRGERGASHRARLPVW
jgi:hypothetical protein